MAQLYYERAIDHSGEYRTTRITVYNAETESIDKLIASCVGNAAGYRDATIAERMLGEYTGLRDRGVTSVVQITYAPWFTAYFQHYRTDLRGGQSVSWEQWEASPDYCDVRLDLADKREDLQKSYDLMRRVERVMLKATGGSSHVAWHAPAHLIAALAKLRAERVWRINHGEYGSDLCTLTARAKDELSAQDWSLAS